MATIPFSVQGTLVYPPDGGQPNAIRAFSASGNFDSKQESDFKVTGTGTLVVSFGTVVNAKVIMVELDQTVITPVNLLIDGSSDPVELSPGGTFLYINPVPAVGVGSLSIVYTAAATGSVRILG